MTAAQKKKFLNLPQRFVYCFKILNRIVFTLQFTIRLTSVDESKEMTLKAENFMRKEKATSETDVTVDFYTATEKLKRKNGFDFPNLSKRLRASDDEVTSSPSLSDSNSSLKMLLSERTKTRIISWSRRNTKSLTDQIVMNK